MYTRLRLFSLTLMAVCALCFTIASTASSDQAGLLLLSGEEGVPTFTGAGGAGTFSTAAGKTIECTAASTSGSANAEEEPHFMSGAGTLKLTGCKEEPAKLGCKTEGAGKGTVEFGYDWHVFDALGGSKELEPGFSILMSTLPLIVHCGATGILELKGAALGLLLIASLTSDVTTGTLDFAKAGEKCDTATGSTYCEEVKKNEPFLTNFNGAFEAAEWETQIAVTFNKMVMAND